MFSFTIIFSLGIGGLLLAKKMKNVAFAWLVYIASVAAILAL